jgi:peptide-methionine (S)-S-oxide reductase
VEGIVDTIVGYSGSKDPQTCNPTYKHIQDYAESIRVQFDPMVLDYKEMLKMFFSYHTPADPQYAGSQYRSAIFYFNEEQKQLSEECVKEWGAFGKYVAVEPASDFYKAELYHQKYMDKIGGRMYY